MTPQIILSPSRFGQNRTHNSFDTTPHKSASLATPSFCCASLNSFQFVLTTVTELSRTECNINIPHTVYSACQAKIRSFMKIDYLNFPIPPVIMESLTIITPNLKNSIHPLIKVNSCFWWLSEMLAFLILTTLRGKPVDFGTQPQKASYHNNFMVFAAPGSVRALPVHCMAGGFSASWERRGSVSTREMLMGMMGFKSSILESMSTLYSPEQKRDMGEKGISHNLSEVSNRFFVCIKQLETSPLPFQANAQV